MTHFCLKSLLHPPLPLQGTTCRSHDVGAGRAHRTDGLAFDARWSLLRSRRLPARLCRYGGQNIATPNEAGLPVGRSFARSSLPAVPCHIAHPEGRICHCQTPHPERVPRRTEAKGTGNAPTEDVPGHMGEAALRVRCAPEECGTQENVKIAF